MITDSPVEYLRIRILNLDIRLIWLFSFKFRLLYPQQGTHRTHKVGLETAGLSAELRKNIRLVGIHNSSGQFVASR
jgi:hypothetical protein